MGLFGGGALKRRIEALSAELATAKADLESARAAAKAAEARIAEQGQALTAAEKKASDASDAMRKAKAKADKANKARIDVDKKMHAIKGRIEHLEKEASEYRSAMLQARRDAESAHAARLDLQREVEGLRLKSQAPAPAAPTPAPQAAPAEERPRAPRPVSDERLERLQSQLAEVRESRDALRDRVAKAEQMGRDAANKQRSDSGRAESVLRELTHNLRAERNAYRILQLQYEALLDRTRGVEQTVATRVADALAKASTDAAPSAEQASPADPAEAGAAAKAAAPVAEVLPDAPPVVSDGDA